MLVELRIRDVGVIDDVTIDLPAGLTVLTGETGAGKTMVVSALQLLLGGRADADRIRADADAAVVEARLVPPPAAAAEWLEDGEDELVVSRQVAAAATTRSKARINGRMAPVAALAACLGAAVELHGQNDSARLGTPAVQRDLLDRYGGASLRAALTAYRDVFDRWRAATRELTGLRANAQERAREADRLRFELSEIDAAAPVAADAGLPVELQRLEHAESLVQGAAAAGAALTDDGGARDGLGAALAALRAVEGVDPTLDALRERAESLAVEAQELGIDLAGYASQLELDPARLDALRDRHAALVRLTRKYGDAAPGALDLDGIDAYARLARIQLEDVEGTDERIGELDAAVAGLAAQLEQAARALRAERCSAGERLVAAVQAHLAELGMAAARMDVAVEAAEPAPHGADDVTFLLAANTGEPALALAKGASGGERSRVALALRVALADADDTPVLVFDEVDAGIGGETALAVGRKLARLAQGRQVLCVTHLAQLAAFADAHFVVEKSETAGRTVAALRRVEDAQRVSELSRMLSGTPDSPNAVRHAAELLDLARPAEVRGDD